MANNFLITQGVGTTLGTDEVGGVHHQKIKLIDPTPGSTTGIGIAANPMRVDPTGTTTQPVSAASLPLPAGAATEATLATRLLDATFTGRINTLGQKTMANSTPVTLASDQSTLPISAASLPLPAGASTEATLALIKAKTDNLDVALSTRLKPADTLAAVTTVTTVSTVTAVTAITNALPAGTNTLGKIDQGVGGASAWKVDGSAVTQPVSGTVTANIGTTGGLALAAPQTDRSQKSQVTDGTRDGTIKAASTAALAADTSFVVALSPNSPVPAGTNVIGHVIADSGSTTAVTGNVTVVQPTGTNLHAVIDSGSTTAVTQATAANLNAQVQGAGASGAAKSGNPVQTGAVFNTTQPTVTTGQTVENQATARGAVIVATGVDTFNVTVNTALPAGTNVIGHIISDSGSTTAVTQATAANLNAQVQGPAASGAAKSGNPLQSGAVFNTTQPTVTTGQVVENQATARGALIVAAGVDGFAVTIATNSAVNVAQISGTAASVNNGTSDAGTLRVTLASNSTGQVTLATGANTIGKVDQGTGGASAWKVDGSAVTQPVSGTVTANIGTTGGLALDTSVNGILLAQASTTAGQTGPLMQGAVTTAAPTYVTAKTNPLSLTTAGALRVDNSANTQPVSGTVAATQSGTWTVQPGNTANTTAWLVTGTGGTFPITAASLPLPTGASTSAAQTDRSQKTQITDGTRDGTLKAASTAAAAADTSFVVALSPNSPVPAGTNVIGHVISDSGSTTAVTGNVTVVQPTGTNLHAVIDSGSTTAVTQATAANLNAQVQGAGASGAAKAGNPVQTGGVFNTTQPTVTTGQAVEAQMTARGAQIVSTGVDTFNVTVNAALPAGTNVIGHVIADSGSTTAVTQATASNLNAQVQGPAASGAAKSGNPVQMGGVFNTTQPTVTTGQSVEAQSTARGALIIATGVDIPIVKDQRAATPAQTSVANSVTNVNLLAANANRLGATIFNDSATASLSVKLGTTASATSFTIRMAANSYYELPANYTGNVDAIASVANGSARITEFTA